MEELIMQNYIKTNIRKGLAVILAASTLGTLTPAFATYKEHPISNYTSLISINYNRVTEDFLNTYGRDNIHTIVKESIGINDTNETKGVVSITTKVLKKVLKEKGDDIILALRKIPAVGNTIGDFLQRHLGSLIDFLDKIEGGAEAALVRFFISMGMQESTAEIWADIIITVVGFLM